MSIEVDIIANQSSIDSALRKISANLRNLEADSKRVSSNISNIAVKNVDTSSVSRELRTLRADISKTNKDLTRSVSNLSSSLTSLARNIALTLTGGVLTAGFVKATSSFNELGNRIALVTGRTDDLILTQEKLINISAKTFTSVETATETFNRFGMALRNANVETSTLLEVTENVQKSIAISGGSAESAAAAIFQLGQGLSAGALRGQELNSVLEQAPRIATAITDELGITIGELRKLAEDGEITTEVILKALLNQGEAINSEFSNIAPTISKASIVFGDALTNYIGQIDRGLGLSERISKRLLNFSETLNTLSVDLDLRVADKLAELDIGKKLSDVKLVAGGVFNVLKAIAGRVQESLPRVIIPVFTLLDKLTIGVRQSFISLFAFYSSLLVEQRAVFADFLQFGNSLERAFFDVFKSKSPEELRKNLDQLAYAISIYGKRWFNLGNAITTIYRSSRVNIEMTLKSLGLMEQKLITFRFETFQDFSFLLRLLNKLFKEFLTNFLVTDFFVSFSRGLVAIIGYLKRVSLSFLATSKDIYSFAKKFLGLTTKTINEFTRTVGKLFYDLYIYLVGGSVWPDTVKEIVAWAHWLSTSVLIIFSKLSRSIANSFKYVITFSSKAISESVDYLTTTIFNKELANQLAKNVSVIYEVILSKINFYKNKIRSQLANSLSLAKEKFISIFSIQLDINLSFSKALAQVISFIQRIEIAIASKITEAIFSAWAYTSEKAPALGLAMGAGLVIGLAELFGIKLLAALKVLWTSALIAEVLTKALGKVGKDLIEQNVFFNLASGLGNLAGTVIASIITNLPLLYTALFDAARGFTDGLLSNFGIIGNFVNRIISTIPGGGLLDLLLFGTGISILLGKFGLIKNLIAGVFSLIMGRAVLGMGAGGLLGWLLLGNGRILIAGILAAFSLLQLIPGLFNDIGNKVATLFGSLGLISILLFGAGNTFKSIIYAIDFIGTYLLRLYGSTASLSLAGLLWPTAAATGLRARILAFWVWLRTTSATQAGRVSLAQSLLAGLLPALRNFTLAYIAQMNSLRARSLAIGGAFGVVGNVLFGRFGRTALMAALIISLFAGVANASETSTSSIMSSMGWLEYGLIGLALFGALRISRLKAAILGVYAWVAASYQAFVVSLAIRGAVASTTGAAITGVLMSTLAVVATFLGKVVFGIIAFLLSKITLGILAIGFLGLLLFGKGDGVFEKVSNLASAITSFFTNTTAGGRQARKELEKLLDPLKSSNLSLPGISAKSVFETLGKVDLGGLNADQVSDIRRNIKKSVSRLEELQQLYENEGRLTRSERREANQLLASIRTELRKAPEAGTRASLDSNIKAILRRTEAMGVAGFSSQEPNFFEKSYLGWSNLLFGSKIPEVTDIEGLTTSITSGQIPLSAVLNIKELQGKNPLISDMISSLSFAVSEGLSIDPTLQRKFNEDLQDLLALNDPTISRKNLEFYLSDTATALVRRLGLSDSGIQTASEIIVANAAKTNEFYKQELSYKTNILSKEEAISQINKGLTTLNQEALSDDQKRLMTVTAAYKLQKALRGLLATEVEIPGAGKRSVFDEAVFATQEAREKRREISEYFKSLTDIYLNEGQDLVQTVNTVLGRFEIESIPAFSEDKLPVLLEGIARVAKLRYEAALSGNTSQAVAALEEAKTALYFELLDYQSTLEGVLKTVELDLTMPEFFMADITLQSNLAKVGKELLSIDKLMSTEAFAAMPRAMKESILAQRNSLVETITSIFREAAVQTNKINYFSVSQDLASKVESLFSSLGVASSSLLPMSFFSPQAENEAKQTISVVEELIADMSSKAAQSAQVDWGFYTDAMMNAFNQLETKQSSVVDRLEYALTLAENPIDFNKLIQLPNSQLKQIDMLVVKLRALQFSMWAVKLVGAITGADITSGLAGVAAQIEAVTKQIDSLIPEAPKSGGGDAKTWWETFTSDVNALGINFGEEFLANLSQVQLDGLIIAAERYKSAQQAINKSVAGEVELRKQAVEQMKLARLEAIDALNDGSYSGLVKQFEAMGASLDANFLGTLNAAQVAYARAVQQKITLLEIERDSLAEGSVELQATTAAMDSLKMKLEELQSSSKVMSDAFKDGLTNFLKGEQTFQEFLEGLLDTFTSTIIEKFSTGFTDALFNSLGLDQMFNSLFQGALELGSTTGGKAASLIPGLELGATPANPLFVSDVAGGVGGSIPTPGANAAAPTSMFSKMFSGVSEMFSGFFKLFGDVFSSIFSAILGIFKFSDGGYVSGPGGPKSDSIMAMVSNGEYVVNAATTKRWLPFLEQINENDGRLPKFAEGGQVGPANPVVFKTMSSNSGRNKSEQVFNINVTGDVSMQARKEIARMIPEITAGVNMTNRERGSR
jgi:tape measure domain-containing protein